MKQRTSASGAAWSLAATTLTLIAAFGAFAPGASAAGARSPAQAAHHRDPLSAPGRPHDPAPRRGAGVQADRPGRRARVRLRQGEHESRDAVGSRPRSRPRGGRDQRLGRAGRRAFCGRRSDHQQPVRIQPVDRSVRPSQRGALPGHRGARTDRRRCAGLGAPPRTLPARQRRSHGTPVWAASQHDPTTGSPRC